MFISVHLSTVLPAFLLLYATFTFAFLATKIFSLLSSSLSSVLVTQPKFFPQQSKGLDVVLTSE